MTRGKFIVFEGVDGSGKSTQVHLLMTAFYDRHIPVQVFREPGDTAVGSKIRQLLLHDESVDISPKTQTMLFMAARAELMILVADKLNRGINVVMDRWAYSTFAYQQDLTIGEWERITDYVSPVWPDVCFWLDILPSVREERLKGISLDKFERLGSGYYDTVISRYGILNSARPEMTRLVVDNDSAFAIHERIMKGYFRHE